MSKYATGKHAKAISDRSGLEFPYREMVREWNGSFVHVSEFEPKQPQLEPKPTSADGIALRHVRTARTENAVPYSLPEDAFETYQAGSRVINVKAPGHGLTNGTTYRFRGPPLATTASGGTFQFSNPQSFDGITGANIAKATGYSITTGIFRSDARVSTDYAVANFFFFTVDTDTATVGEIKGGGVGCSVGPVTLSA
jgi:hypothetical protein